MLIVYLLLGIYILIKNSNNIPLMFNNIIKSAFDIKSIISVFLIGMQRAIFITESGIGTSAISSSVVENNEENQAMLEVMGIHITTFLVCNVTFIIIAMSNYTEINFNNINITLRSQSMNSLKTTRMYYSLDKFFKISQNEKGYCKEMQNV